MISDIGYGSLVAALLVALTGGAACLTGASRQRGWRFRAELPAILLLAFLALAFISLTAAFVLNDFSLRYVIQHSSTTLSLDYRISAVWGGHEGSLLLCTLILGVWTWLVACRSRSWPIRMRLRVLGILMWLTAAFLLVLLLASNPFVLTDPTVAGRGLNPLLQNPAMLLHPPMLYIGYIGLAVPCAMAMAALWETSFDNEWIRRLRPWVAAAWSFLTLGIALGSWWAYTELGWGGWWFWDPVENVALMPWLVATALLHALVVSARNGLFHSWSLLLALAAFSLSLLGIFLVRSGILISVHAFAADPRRGAFFLILLTLFLASALVLFVRHRPVKETAIYPGLWSREALLLAGTVFLIVSCATVLLGTLYPLLVQVLGLGRISVGAPYFNQMMALLLTPALLLMLVTPCVNGQKTSAQKPLCHRGRNFSMYLAHGGVIVFVLGATFSGLAQEERELRMVPGEKVRVASHVLQWQGVQLLEEKNFLALQGKFELSTGGGAEAVLLPEKRLYRTSPMMTTESAIDSRLFRDVLVSLAEPDNRDQPFGAWTVRIQVKPLMCWIWLGFLLVALGGLSLVLRSSQVCKIES